MKTRSANGPKPAHAARIGSARDTDRDALAGLLREAGLPHEDFAIHLKFFLVARDGERIVGAVGAEVCGRDALLRSLVVAPTDRGTGIGRQLMDALERAAGPWGVERWWLLTTTAEKFFAARGFRSVPRGEVPAAIAATKEFRELCPSVATCMTRGREVGVE